MVAHVHTPKEQIEEQHGDLASLVKTYLPNALTISVISISGLGTGQMILFDPAYDKTSVIARLRLCADILDGKCGSL